LLVGGAGFSDEKAAELGALGYAGSLPDVIKLVQILGCQGQDSEGINGSVTAAEAAG